MERENMQHMHNIENYTVDSDKYNNITMNNNKIVKSARNLHTPAINKSIWIWLYSSVKLNEF